MMSLDYTNGLRKNGLILLGALLALCACEEDLFQNPITEKSVNNFYRNEGEIESAINGVYSTLQFTGLYNLYLPAIGEMPSDNTFDEVPANDGGRYGQLDEFTTITSNEVITGIWKDSYIGIQQANVILNRITDVEFVDPTTKLARIGELKFIRGLLYFNLVRIYGDVPLVLQETTDPTAYFGQGRTPIDQVYAQIEKDLSEAISVLPLQSNKPGRAIKTAAQGILAKVYMTRNNFQDAKPLLESIVEVGIHQLEPNPASIFELDNELNAEIIFAVQFASGLTGNSEGSDAFVQFSPSGTVNGAKGHNLPTRSFFAKFDPQDLRAEAYVGITEQGTPYTKKYKEPSTVPSDGPSDWIVLRYADILLLLAEIEHSIGNNNTALYYLNQVRERAGLQPISHTVSEELLGNTIALERRFELIGEGHRWFDLLRTGKAITTMNNWFQENSIPKEIGKKDLLMPIPQSQIDTDPALVQNPGY